VRSPDLKPVAVGDLVRWRSVQNDNQEEFDVDIGIVLRLSRSGRTSLQAEVLFDDRTVSWIPDSRLEIISSKQTESP
jgi:stress response protein SCP2